MQRENKAKQYFEANLLDGDKMEDCGKATIVIDDEFIEVFNESVDTARAERDKEIVEMIENHPDLTGWEIALLLDILKNNNESQKKN